MENRVEIVAAYSIIFIIIFCVLSILIYNIVFKYNCESKGGVYTEIFLYKTCLPKGVIEKSKNLIVKE